MPIINSVIAGGGTTPTGTKSITANGTHDVAAYEYADVQVPTTVPALYRVYQVNRDGELEPSKTYPAIMDFTGVRGIPANMLYGAYLGNTVISGTVDMSDCVYINQNGCYQMFYGCTGITGVDLSSFLRVNGNSGCYQMFFCCAGITSIDISLLTKISGSNGCYSMFGGTAVTSVVLSSLTDIKESSACTSMFASCPNLTSLSFPSITPNSFGSKKDQFNNICFNVSNITLHFPSNTQAKIETLTGYSTTTPFGAVAGTILFDLPATNTLTGADSKTYSRNPKYDTATALAWKVGAYGTTDFTPAYYTSGTSDPQANDTIYSDAACTTAVTTISSIA